MVDYFATENAWRVNDTHRGDAENNAFRSSPTCMICFAT
jgi:hypothetical protein